MASRHTFKPIRIKESLIIHEDQINEFEERGYSIKRVKGQLRAYKEMEKWEEFEAEIRKFLEILGFENVNKSPITLGGHKVDVVGGRDETFLIIECKTRREITGSEKGELEKFNGWKDDIIRDIRKKYPAYPNIKFIFCTDFIVDDKSKEFAKDNDVVLWDCNYIREYEDLYSILGDSTKYHILHELECRPKLSEDFYVPAFRMRQRGRMAYSFFIEPEMLLKISYVFRRTSAPRERAYQRPLKAGRLERIRKFLEEENGVFINNIIINFKEKLNFRPISIRGRKIEGGSSNLSRWPEFGILKIPNYYCSAEIIDGQHRTYGFTKAEIAKRELRLSVVALDNASEIERATFFIKINKEQKPVEANLLWDLAGEIEPESESGIISNAVKKLNKVKPFKNVIFIPSIGDKQKPITIAGFCKGIEDRGFIKILKTSDDLFRGLKQYFLLTSALFDFDWMLGKKGFICVNSGINVMLRIIKRILMINKDKMPSLNKIKTYLKPMAIFFKKTYYKKDGKPNERKLSTLRKRCANEAGRGDTEKEFWDQLEKRPPKGIIV